MEVLSLVVDDDAWKDVTDEQIERSRRYFSGMAKLAWSHSCSILMGCPKWPTSETSSASGVFLKVRGRHFLATAFHVIEGFDEMRKMRGHVHFQVGELELCPFHSLAYHNKSDDLAIMEIQPWQVQEVGSTPFVAEPNWPPPSPLRGQLVQFCGYARINRKDGEAGLIDSTVLPLVGVVSASSESHFAIRIEREKYRWDGDCLLPPNESFLGGMSGGPAMLLTKTDANLVGIVSEGSEAFDIVRFTPLSRVPWLEITT